MSEHTKGELLIVGSGFFFALSAVIVKMVSRYFDGNFISLFRFAVGIVLGGLFLGITKHPFKVAAWKPWLLRGLTGFVSMILYYFAITMVGSGRATLFNSLSPFFTALFGIMIFHERLNFTNIIGLGLCLIGVFVVFFERNEFNLWGDLGGILSGVILGLSFHYTKLSVAREHPVVVYLSPCFCGMSLIPFCWSQVYQIQLPTAIILILVGVFSFVAQLLLAYGIRTVPVNRSGILSNAKIPITIILGSFSGEKVGWKLIIGTVLIIFGLLINKSHISGMAKLFLWIRRRAGKVISDDVPIN